MALYLATVLIRPNIPGLRGEDCSTQIETIANDEIQARRQVIHEVQRSKYIVSDILEVIKAKEWKNHG